MAKSIPIAPRGCPRRWPCWVVMVLVASMVGAVRQSAWAETGFASVKICPERASDGDQITCRIVSQNVSTTEGGQPFGVQGITVQNSFDKITLIPSSVVPTCSACQGTDTKCTSDADCGGAVGSCAVRCTTDSLVCYRTTEAVCGSLAGCTPDLSQPLTNGSITVAAGNGAPGGDDTFICLIQETVYGLGTCAANGIEVVDTVVYEGMGVPPGAGLSASDVRAASVLINCCGDNVVNVPGEFCDTGLTGAVPDPIALECPNPNPFVSDGVNDLGCIAGVDQQCRNPGDPGECTICGDGLVQPGLESCDRTDFAGGGAPVALRGECRVTGAAACTYCGDGAVQPDTGETCDDGTLSGSGNDGGCRSGELRCTRCGDGVVQGSLEKCDSGPDGPYSAAGDGVGDSHDGQCRNPSDYPGNGCTACGDGVWQTDIEQCDPTDASSPSNCKADCTLECVTASECNDGDPCTDEACVDNLCVPTPIPGCVPCTTAGDCDDGEVCTTDACVADQCVWTPIPGCVPCTTAGDCGDGELCTTDACVNDQCVWTPIEGCTDVPCDTPDQCDDNDVCTTDTCVVDVCASTPIPGCMECETAQDCGDDNQCTIDSCVDNVCVYTPISGCCVTDDDCGDGDTCTVDVCVDDACVELPSFLVKVRGQVGNFSEIYGNFGINDAGGQLRFGREVFVVDGASTSGDFVRIGNGSSVYDLFGNHVALGNGVVVRGVSGPADAPLTEPFCPVDPFVCGTSRVTVGSGTVSSPLAPGVYGSVRVFNGATLRLAPGEFTFCEIRTGRRASILTSGPTTINVVGKVRISNGSTFGPSSGAVTPVVKVLGPQVRVGAGSVMQAHLSAPNAMLTMGRLSEFRGTFCVFRTRSDKRIALVCPPDERPSASPSGAFLGSIAAH